MRQLKRWQWVAACLTWGLLTQAGPLTAAPNAAPPALTLPEVEANPGARSQVPFVVGIELAWAKAILEERVPILLHQETNREVGSGVSIDVKVTRGAIHVQVGPETILLMAPIEADINVRSRLGSYVLPIGNCRPIVDAEVTLRLQLSADGKLPRPTAKANLRTPCRLSGFDVTPFLQREIERQLTQGDSETAKHLNLANGVVAELYGETLRRLANPVAGCLRFVPEQLRQGPIVEEQGLLVTRLVADGTLAQRCEPVTALPMRVVQARDPGGLQLIWQRHVTWPDLNRTIVEHLRKSGIDATEVSSRSARREGQDLVAVFVRTSNRKGWLLATPQMLDGSIRLTNLGSDDAALLKSTQSALEGFTIPVDRVAILVLAQQIVAEANQLSQIFGHSPELKRSYQIRDAGLQTLSDVGVDRDGLLVVIRRQQVAPHAAQ